MIAHLVSGSRPSNAEDGASSVEYGLLVAAIATVIVIIVFALGGVVRNLFSSTCDTISTNASSVTSTCS